MLITFKLRSLVRVGDQHVYVNLNIYKSRENNMIFMKPMFSFNNCQFTTDMLILNIIPVFSIIILKPILFFHKYFSM